MLIPIENGSVPELLNDAMGSKKRPKQFLTPIITKTIIEQAIRINFQLFISLLLI